MAIGANKNVGGELVKHAEADSSAIPAPILEASSVLIIEPAEEFADYISCVEGKDVVRIPQRLLTGQMLSSVRPDVILAPLIEQYSDFLSLGRFLLGRRFSGQIFAMAPPLPSVEMVISEVSAQLAPLKITVLEIQGYRLPIFRTFMSAGDSRKAARDDCSQFACEEVLEQSLTTDISVPSRVIALADVKSARSVRNRHCH